MASSKIKVGVIGDGAWSTAVAMLLARNGHSVKVWGVFPEYLQEISETRNNRKFLPGIDIPYEVEFTDDVAELVNGIGLLVEGVPTRYLRSVIRNLASSVPKGVPVVSLTKGIEEENHIRPSQIIREGLGHHTTVVVLSGPSHAEEVAMELPTSVVAASLHEEHAIRVQDAFSGPSFRVYTSMDVVGVEIGGALKNVIALGAGISDGLGFGDNAKAALLTRGIKEIADLGAVLGGNRKTFSGLSGIGDLIVTCTSRHGRNHAVGERIGRGESLEDILESTEKVAEGVYTVKGAKLLADKHKIGMPITNEVFEVLYNGKEPKTAVEDLMARTLKGE